MPWEFVWGNALDKTVQHAKQHHVLICPEDDASSPESRFKLQTGLDILQRFFHVTTQHQPKIHSFNCLTLPIPLLSQNVAPFRASVAFGFGRWFCSRRCELLRSVAPAPLLGVPAGCHCITDCERRHWINWSLAVQRCQRTNTISFLFLVSQHIFHCFHVFFTISREHDFRNQIGHPHHGGNQPLCHQDLLPKSHISGALQRVLGRDVFKSETPFFYRTRGSGWLHIRQLEI